MLEKLSTMLPRLSGGTNRPPGMSRDPVLARLHPGRLVVRAQSMPREAFTRDFGDTWMLLVQVAQGSLLAEGIQLTDEEPRLSDTDTSTLRSVSPAAFAPRTKAPSTAEQRMLIRQTLAHTALVALPLRKRTAAQRPFADRVALGRAGNCDMVLVDDSVSRFHAWFEPNACGGFLLADAGSKNGTFVGNERLLPRELRPLSPGDEVRFGSVMATVCEPEMFWDVVVA